MPGIRRYINRHGQRYSPQVSGVVGTGSSLMAIINGVDAVTSLLERLGPQPGQPAPSVLMIAVQFLLTAVLLLVGVTAIYVWWVRRDGLGEFYSDRDAKGRVRGELKEEVSDGKEVWLAFESGTDFAGWGDYPRSVGRVLLLDPGSAHARSMLDWSGETAAQHQSDVERAVARCCENEIAYRLYAGPIINAVIAEPFDEDRGWARIQLQLWARRSAQWPSLVVYGKDNPELFRRIRQSFEEIWNGGTGSVLAGTASTGEVPGQTGARSVGIDWEGGERATIEGIRTRGYDKGINLKDVREGTIKEADIDREADDASE